MYKYTLGIVYIFWLNHKVTAQYYSNRPQISNVWGNVECVEPEHNFKGYRNRNKKHNTDIPDQPENWTCEYCEGKLHELILAVCCDRNSRQKRAAKDEIFWHGSSQNSTKLTSKKVKKSSSYHPKHLIYKKATDDCVHDLIHKDGGQTEFDILHLLNPELQHDHLNQKLENKKLKRKKRNTPRENQTPNEDGTYPAKWHKSISHGGKGRSTFSEIVPRMMCKKEIATQVLRSGPKANLFRGSHPNKARWKHTFIAAECCDKPFGNDVLAQGSCDNEEVKGMGLSEECCHEGCMIEEVHEGCEAWRWNMKMDWREERKTQYWRPDVDRPSQAAIGETNK